MLMDLQGDGRSLGKEEWRCRRVFLNGEVKAKRRHQDLVGIPEL